MKDVPKQAVEVGSTVGKVKLAIKKVSDVVREIMIACEDLIRRIKRIDFIVHQIDQVTQDTVRSLIGLLRQHNLRTSRWSV